MEIKNYVRKKNADKNEKVKLEFLYNKSQKER